MYEDDNAHASRRGIEFGTKIIANTIRDDQISRKAEIM